MEPDLLPCEALYVELSPELSVSMAGAWLELSLEPRLGGYNRDRGLVYVS